MIQLHRGCLDRRFIPAFSVCQGREIIRLGSLSGRVDLPAWNSLVPSAAASFSTKPEITRGLRRPVPTPTRWNSISGVPPTCAQSPFSLSLSLSRYFSLTRAFSLSLSPTPSPLCSPSCPSEYTLCRVCVYSSAFECVVASTASPRSMYTSIPSCCSLPPRWIYEVKASG